MTLASPETTAIYLDRPEITNLIVYLYRIGEWLTCDFASFSTVFQSTFIEVISGQWVDDDGRL